MRSTLPARVAIAGAAIAFAAASRSAGAQASAGPSPRHPPVCAGGVRTYASISEVPTPFDSLTLPPAPPLRVTSPSEAAAAEDAMHGLAGSVGATGLVVTDETETDGGVMRVRRRVLAVFVPSDSARAQQACKR
ncbi:MAG TPA: hypothetical protein VMF70_07550 [Gemmatimonadales bacterium]|nr:hypothetical protein [Gemmatimonadales bacterium]